MILLSLEILFGAFLWLLNAEGFIGLIGVISLGMLFIYCVAVWISYRGDRKKAAAISDFLEDPNAYQENRAASSVKGYEKEHIHLLGEILREKEGKIRDMNMQIQEYEEYIEGWAHEIKTPRALMTFVLDNRRDELGPPVYQRLEYVRNQMQEDIDRMLYYARLKSSHHDYIFESLSLRDCCVEVLQEYSVSLKEHNFTVINKVEDVQIVSDHKGLTFMVSQALSNSIKYQRPGNENPRIELFTDINNAREHLVLVIKDNGIGAKDYDLPFIFDKGFVGDTGKANKTATGMGLYLLKQMAEHLAIDLAVESEEGFQLDLLFPKVER